MTWKSKKNFGSVGPRKFSSACVYNAKCSCLNTTNFLEKSETWHAIYEHVARKCLMIIHFPCDSDNFKATPWTTEFRQGNDTCISSSRQTRVPAFVVLSLLLDPFLGVCKSTSGLLVAFCARTKAAMHRKANQRNAWNETISKRGEKEIAQQACTRTRMRTISFVAEQWQHSTFHVPIGEEEIKSSTLVVVHLNFPDITASFWHEHLILPQRNHPQSPLQLFTKDKSDNHHHGQSEASWRSWLVCTCVVGPKQTLRWGNDITGRKSSPTICENCILSDGFLSCCVLFARRSFDQVL